MDELTELNKLESAFNLIKEMADSHIHRESSFLKVVELTLMYQVKLTIYWMIRARNAERKLNALLLVKRN